jgi:Ca-activated chloride channel family protein
VWDYNQGNPTGDPATLGKHPKPRTPLVAIYPKEGTLVSDSPYVILNAPWVDGAKREAAQGFLAFLQRPDQQRRFQAAAFRDFRGRPGPVIDAANGLDPKQPARIITPPAPAVLDGIERSWTEVRKRARVLLVIDVSGSMGNRVPGTSSTKLDLAKRAAIRALGQFAPDDQVGLWVFSSDFPPDGAPILQLEPVGPLGPKLDEMRRRIDNLQPFESTALYVTIREAANRMRASFDPQRINAVVLLTDGINDYQDPLTLGGLVRNLRSESEDRAVRVFPIAYGGDADLKTLQAVATASRGAAYDASDPESIDKVFTAVISNF